MVNFAMYNFNRKIEGVYVDVLGTEKKVKPFETASDLAEAIRVLQQEVVDTKTTEVSFGKKKYSKLETRVSWLDRYPSKFKDSDSQAFIELIRSFDEWVNDVYKVTGVERKDTHI